MTQTLGHSMTWAAFALVITGVLLNAIAQLALKASVSDTGIINLDIPSLLSSAGSLASNLWLWLGLICYAISVVVWILALSRVDVSIAYPMLSIGYIVNAIAAAQLFNEPMGIGKVAGIGIIMLGVYILGILVILQSLGISITPVLTALGVGGLAVALALQETLSNLFAGVAILAESHLAIHTWPEHGFAAVELFVCGAEGDPSAGDEVLRAALRPTHTETRLLERGDPALLQQPTT